MKVKSLLFAALVTFCLPQMVSSQQKCNVEGTVINRPKSKYALMIESGRDFRITGFKGDTIKNGKFFFTIPADTVRQYEIMFDDEMSNGAWRTRKFFAEPGTVKLVYHGENEENKDHVEATTPANLQLIAMQRLMAEKYRPQLEPLYAAMDSIYDHNLAYSDEAASLYKKIRNTSDRHERDSLFEIWNKLRKTLGDKFYSDAHNDIDAKTKRILQNYYKEQTAFIKANPGIYGLTVLKDNLLYASDLKDTGEQISIFDEIYANNPGLATHPYTEEIRVLTDGKAIVPGKRYPNLKFRRADGSSEEVLSLLGGKPAVIDLWASWCGPCRRHSMELIPLYEKYRGDGFKVIAVARESGNTEEMEAAMKADGYPWESFVDLNDRDSIWRRNGAGNAGGRIILVDGRGIIKAVDASAEEIEGFLKEEFKH